MFFDDLFMMFALESGLVFLFLVRVLKKVVFFLRVRLMCFFSGGGVVGEGDVVLLLVIKKKNLMKDAMYCNWPACFRFAVFRRRLKRCSSPCV